jgi:hypothetical protein
VAVNQIEAMKVSFTKGAKVKEQTSTMQKGVNVLQLQLGGITPGTYFLTAIDAKGKKLFQTPF